MVSRRKKVTMDAPRNEQELIVLFAQYADELGYEIVSTQTRFPDAVLRFKENDATIEVEFEFSAKNFIAHRHDPAGCDLVVCWVNDLSPRRKLPVPVFSLQVYLQQRQHAMSRRAEKLHARRQFGTAYLYACGITFFALLTYGILRSMP